MDCDEDAPEIFMYWRGKASVLLCYAKGNIAESPLGPGKGLGDDRFFRWDLIFHYTYGQDIKVILEWLRSIESKA
jgi:hypothetical protein